MAAGVVVTETTLPDGAEGHRVRLSTPKSRGRVEVTFASIPAGKGGTGCYLWTSGLVLARWICEHSEWFSGKTVLELGSGCGLAGFTAAHYAERVFVTDFNDGILDNLRRTCGVNPCRLDAENAEGGCGNVFVRKVNWNNQDEVDAIVEEANPDIVIGSDLVYTAATDLLFRKDVVLSSNNYSPLCKTISRILETSRVRNTYFRGVFPNKRENVEKFADELRRLGCECSRKPIAATADEMSFGARRDTETFSMYEARWSTPDPEEE